MHMSSFLSKQHKCGCIIKFSRLLFVTALCG